MATTEDLLAAVEASTKIDPTAKGILGDFLRAAGPAVAALGPGAFSDLMATVARGESVPSTLADSLSQKQVVALLGQTEAAMAGMVEKRVAQQAAAKAAIDGLAGAALSILLRLILAAL